MVLNYIWVAFFVIAFIVALIKLLFMGNTEIFTELVNSTFTSSKTAFEISLGLTGILSLWLGTSILSYLGRLTYNYNDKYYLTATYRVDGSSKFLSKNKWASFPSASIAWRMSNEPFMESIKSVLNSLKLRIGWGRVGNQNLPSGVYMSQLGQGYYVLGDNVVNTVYPSLVKNEDVKWETVEDYNFGIDYGLFDKSFNGLVR